MTKRGKDGAEDCRCIDRDWQLVLEAELNFHIEPYWWWS